MGWADLLLRLRALLHRRRAEDELDEELSFHLEMQARKSRRAGMSDAEARRTARVDFGGMDQVREQCRDVRGLTVLENLARDVRYGARMLRKTPGFTLIAVLSLAIGIGGNTAVFSLLDAVLLRTLPVRNPEELVVARWGAHRDLDLGRIWATNGDDGHGAWTSNVFSWAIFSEMRARSRTAGSVVGFSPLGPVDVAFRGQAVSTGAIVVSGNFFRALGVGAILGRPIADDDDRSGGLPSAVISYRFWERAFALDPAAIGQTLYVNGRPCIVAGVTPKEFFGISAGGFMLTPEIDITLPIRSRAEMEGSGRRRMAWFGDDLLWVQVMARLNSGETAAKSELAAIVAANLPESARRDLGSEMPRVYLDPGAQGLDSLRSVYHKPLLILMAVVGLTLLMACANLAGLLLARATARQREIMVRLAMGASRARLVRQLLVEGALLSGIGAAGGLAFAWWGVRALLALVASGSTPIPIEVSPDARVLAFTAAVSVVTTFLFALAPAMRATRVDVAGGLKEDTPPAAAMQRFGAGRVLLTVQVAIALVLLAGATLFTRSLANLRSLPLGFNPHHLMLFDLAPGNSGYNEIRANQLYAQVRERLRQTPGVTGASLSASRLISGFMSNGSIVVQGQVSKRSVRSTFNFVGPSFFEVMGMSLTLGRGIELRDMGPAAPVAVINEAAARRYFAGGSPLGRRFRWDFGKQDRDVEVIGVVKDAKYDRLQGEAPETIYAPYTQSPFGWQQEMTFEVRIAGSEPQAAAGIRRAVAEADRMIPLTRFKTQEAQIDDYLSQERLFASLVGLFSVITLVLACVGLYGSVSYAVTRRTRELGVRMALGADRLAVMRTLLGQVAATIGAGLALGLPAALALTRVIESQLYGIKPHDPISFLAASAAVAGTAILAALLPARRAMRIDPVRALRYE